MTTVEFIDRKKVALDAYEKEIRAQLPAGDAVGSLVIVAALEAFGHGFDAAVKLYETAENLKSGG